ncbi:(2Fe-2S) ferredoxin domain-containing protein [Oscillatoria salina]|uniref:(2Fe-2S) ferredoxin domain-containing protein n=1 Tax=Oscillatoria salina TaxID=331517 RepID=UPI001CCD6032|nr:(2Fe-2S) ferredoxin domain-containing protein [Oscillatoria salina]
MRDFSNSIIDEDCQERKRCVLVCQNTSCRAAGSPDVLAAFEAADLPEDVIVKPVGCQGQCSIATTVRILPEETWYCRVKSSDVKKIVEQHLHEGKIVEEKLNPRIHRSYSFY